MLADDLLSLLKSDPRNSTELSQASGVHAVAIRKLRTKAKSMDGVTIATGEQLAAALGGKLVLLIPKKSKK